MSSVIHCPNCKTPLFVPQELIGQVMACPTCQRPIQFVAPGTSPVALSSVASAPAVPGAPKSLPKAAPLSPAATMAPPISLEPAPAMPKYSAETSQLEVGLRPTPSRPSRGKDDSISPLTVITWGVVAAMVLVSGVVVIIVSNSGGDERPAAKANVPAAKPPVPPMLSIPRAGRGAGETLPEAAYEPPVASAPAASGASSANTPPVAKAPYLPPVPVASAPRLPPPPVSDVRAGSTVSTTNSGIGPVETTPSPESAPSTTPTPTSVTISETTAAPPAGILDAIDDAWRLPALISTADEPMASLAEDPSEPIHIALGSTLAAIGATAAIFAEKTDQPGEWSLIHVADLQSPDKKTPLAKLRLAGRQFSFAWASLDVPDLRRQVANCVLEIHHGQHKRIVQLRPRQQEAACTLDLEKDVQVREFAVTDLPKLDALRLEIAGLDGFAGEPKLQSDSLAIGKETAIEFKNPPGAEIGISFRKQATGNLLVRLEPVFREAGAKEFDMTLKRLETMEDGVTRALRAAEKELPAKQREVAGLNNAYRRLKGNRPSNPLLVPAWQTELNEIGKDLDRAANRVATLQKLIPTQKARLKAVPQLRAFLSSMHQTAVIRMRVVVENGERDLVLVDATVPSQGVSAAGASSE
jgi:hypothetical protein